MSPPADVEDAARERKAMHTAESLLAEMKKVNRNFEKYGPVLDRLMHEVEHAKELPPPPGPRTPIDYLGEALLSGRFDGVIFDLTGYDPTAARVGKRRRAP